MEDNAAIFWENVKKEIKLQNTTQEWVAQKAGISFNTFQGWISKEIYPRVNEAVRIAAVLNISVELLVNGSIRNNVRAIEQIYQTLPKIQEYLDHLKELIREIR